jgi:hypothetical protein
MSTNNPPEMLTSELTMKYVPPVKPQAPLAHPLADKHLLLLDTFAAYRALMYDITNEQLDNLQDSETVDDLKEGLCAAAVFYTAAMEEVDRATRGPEYAAANLSDSELEPGLTEDLLKMARLNQFVIEQQIPSGNLTYAGAQMVKRAHRLHELFMSNTCLTDEIKDAVAAVSLVALQYIACCYIIPTEAEERKGKTNAPRNH